MHECGRSDDGVYTDSGQKKRIRYRFGFESFYTICIVINVIIMAIIIIVIVLLSSLLLFCISLLSLFRLTNTTVIMIITAIIIIIFSILMKMKHTTQFNSQLYNNMTSQISHHLTIFLTFIYLSGLINESVLVQEFLVGKEYVIDKVTYTRTYDWKYLIIFIIVFCDVVC